VDGKKCIICGYDYTQDIFNYPSLTRLSRQQIKLQKEKMRPNADLQSIDAIFRLKAELAKLTYLIPKLYKEDPERASYSCYFLSADWGFADYQYALGRCYENGIGTDVDYQKALEWYDQAAKQGNKQAEKAALELREKIASKK
jgi:TPR repeat protein